MKKHDYIGLWLLLIVGLLSVMSIALCDDITIGKWVVKKAPIWDTLLEDKSESIGSKVDGDTNESNNIVEEEEKPIETDSLPQSIFIFGDSMTYNLALRLAQYAEANGHQIHSVNWDSSNTKIWAEHDTLRNYIEKFRPTQIFISLGSNELYYKNPSSREPYIKKILEVIDTIPYVWIGPPNWKEDTGMNDLLAKSCRPKSFFRSEGMTFERKADKVHPTRKSSALWVDSIIRWLPNSSHPFIMNVPADSIVKSNPHIVFLKALNK